MNAPGPPHWTLNSCSGAFHTNFGTFGTVCLPYSVQNGQNWCKSLYHEVASEFFATNTIDPPPLDPKLMFLCVSCYLGAFGTIWLCYNTQSKMDQTGAKVRDTKSRQNFSQRTHSIHPNGPKTHIFCAFNTILVQLGLFGWLAKLDGKCAELV